MLMFRLAATSLVATLGLLMPARQAAQSDSGLTVRAVRFYRADQNQTRVKGLVQIPMSAIAPIRDDVAEGGYSVSVRVADSTGLTLFHQDWSTHVPTGAGAPEQYAVEIVDFAIAPGQYRFEVSVKDSVSGRSLSSGVDISALADTSPASDLLVSPEMRLPADSEAGPRPGEFRTGNNLIVAAARAVITPLRPKVYYLLEAYAPAEEKGSLSVSVADSSGKMAVQTTPVPIVVSAGGSILKGQLDLTGLPPGTFTMTAEMKLEQRVVRRSAEFVMAGLGESLARDSARRADARGTDEGYFAELNAEQLDQAKAPLVYIAASGELSPWNNKLSVAAKRRLLTNFWQSRDPSPGTPRNERRESFYAAIAYANETYREGGRNAVSGWRSDRGRVYARNGAPGEVYRRQQEGRAPPYEVWRYSTGKGLYYIFADRSGFGAYTLIYSNDLKEPGMPGWAEILGGAAVQDAGRFLGVDLVSASRRS
jgi:GWxTD domain-containing protein